LFIGAKTKSKADSAKAGFFRNKRKLNLNLYLVYNIPIQIYNIPIQIYNIQMDKLL